MYKAGDKFEVVSGGDAFTVSGDFDVHTDTTFLTIRIPT